MIVKTGINVDFLSFSEFETNFEISEIENMNFWIFIVFFVQVNSIEYDYARGFNEFKRAHQIQNSWNQLEAFNQTNSVLQVLLLIEIVLSV